ncbi:MAG: S41 family peptidase [Bacteroidales bacterium]|nr:S41 family peptidase [Bacteroidales bacterium]
MRKIIKTGLFLSVLLTIPVFWSTRVNRDFELSKNLDIFHSLMRELDLYYVDETDPGKLITTGIKGMLKTLDPYTVYIPENQIEDIKLMTTGEYGGVGAMIAQKNDRVIITNPYENTPAQRAGLRPGDVIMKIDGKSVAGKSSKEISMLMKGRVGSSVQVTVSRPFSNRKITVDLTREKIRIPNVPYYTRMDRTGYIRLSGFTEGAAGEVSKALNDLKQQGIDRLVLDLRSNPGGLLIEAVEIMNLFVPRNCEIVNTRGKIKQWENSYFTRHEPVDTLIPVAILVNSGSASASEIVAGAMQDLDRGVIIGQRTFGKGLVQSMRNLSYNAKLKLTTAKYYIPSGRCIQALDYSHRRPDGSVGKIPDSLISEFRTKNNRLVYDGGGIQPDVTTPVRRLSNTAVFLVYQSLIFDFANKYRNTGHPVPGTMTFQIKDTVYREFKEFVKSRPVNYHTESEQAMESLISKAKEEKYYQKNSTLFNELQKRMQPDLDRDMNRFAPEIRSLLAEEIIDRYHYQRGRIAYMLRDDPVVHKAMEILSDTTGYKKILGY